MPHVVSRAFHTSPDFTCSFLLQISSRVPRYAVEIAIPAVANQAATRRTDLDEAQIAELQVLNSTHGGFK